MKHKIKAALVTGRAHVEKFIRELRVEQLNPFARPKEAADPYAVYRLEDQALARDFALDADAAAIGQDPERARKVIKTVGIVVGVFLLFAMFARVDELT